MVKLAIKALKPANLPTAQEYLAAIEKATYKSAGLILRDFEATVRTWDKKPTFDVTITNQGGDYSVTAGTDNEIYGYVDAGTKPHVIRAKRSKYLRYSSGYKAKTRVGVIDSNDGGASGDDVFSKEVHHPGFPGRKFSERIQKRRQTTVAQEISAGIAKVALGRAS